MARPKKGKPAARPFRPKQPRLPGTEDAAIEELEGLAMEYAEVRDQRMVLNKQEVELKGRIAGAMHKNGKSEYRHNGIEIRLVVEEEGVRVKILKDDKEAA